MAGPAFEIWIENLGLRQVLDPALEKPTFRKPHRGTVLLADELESRIGDSLRAHRAKHKLSIQKVAKLLGISVSVYLRYERGRSRLTVSRLIQICEVLGTHPEDMLGYAVPQLFSETEEHALQVRLTIKELRKLDVKTLETFRNLMKEIRQA